MNSHCPSNTGLTCPCGILSLSGKSAAEKSQMASSDMAMGMIFLSQTVIGLLGNFFLLYHYSVLYFTRATLRSTDFVVKHLTVANILIFLSKGILQTLSALGVNYFLGNIGCQLVFYVHRVSRGVSIGSTCLLSIFQAFTISPRNSRWAELKLHTPQYFGLSHSLILCWVVNMLVNIIIPMHITGKWNGKNHTTQMDFLYCSWVDNNRVPQLLVIILLSSYDVLCLGLMIWASGSMVFILYRHRQQVQHIHRTHLSSESRVIETILVLVSTFVSFYTLSYLFSLYIVPSYNPSKWLVNISALITACFPTVSPFVLISRDPRIPKPSSACCEENTQLPKLVK